jgi:hypothetical protein
MKFYCLCGKLYSDNTDNIPYKAHLVADEDWNAFTARAKPRVAMTGVW